MPMMAWIGSIDTLAYLSDVGLNVRQLDAPPRQIDFLTKRIVSAAVKAEPVCVAPSACNVTGTPAVEVHERSTASMAAIRAGRGKLKAVPLPVAGSGVIVTPLMCVSRTVVGSIVWPATERVAAIRRLVLVELSVRAPNLSAPPMLMQPLWTVAVLFPENGSAAVATDAVLVSVCAGARHRATTCR